MTFLVFDGPECGGKSTTLNALKERLINRQVPFVLSREPGGTDVTEKIRELALNETMLPKTEALLMYAARHEHLETVIKPALAEGNLVILDRFNFSTAVYQFLLKGKTYADFLLSDQILLGNSCKPNKTFIFDVPVEVTLARMNLRGVRSKYDVLTQEKHEAIRSAYLEIVKNNIDDVVLLDGTLKTDDLVNEIMKYIGPTYE